MNLSTTLRWFISPVLQTSKAQRQKVFLGIHIFLNFIMTFCHFGQMPPLPVDVLSEIIKYLEWQDVMRLRRVGHSSTITG